MAKRNESTYVQRADENSRQKSGNNDGGITATVSTLDRTLVERRTRLDGTLVVVHRDLRKKSHSVHVSGRVSIVIVAIVIFAGVGLLRPDLLEPLIRALAVLTRSG